MNKEQQKETMSDTELKLRTLLAFSYCGPMLYHDDGELQDNTAHPFIDFKNDNVNTIADKMLRRTEDVFSNTRTNAKAELIKKVEGLRSSHGIEFAKIDDVIEAIEELDV